jgi:hypothetical protein
MRLQRHSPAQFPCWRNAVTLQPIHLMAGRQVATETKIAADAPYLAGASRGDRLEIRLALP